MSNFNENPFLKDTPVFPFSNGSEAENWHYSNCQSCINYESESTDEEKAKCKLAFHIDMGFISSEIPLWVAKEVGCTYDPLYARVKLSNKCRKFSDGTEPF